MQEEWKQVTYKGIAWPYDVSNMGRVRNKHGKVSDCHAGVHGYPRVTLCNGGIYQPVAIHLLVAQAFLGPANGKKVRHWDRDTENNQVSNLVYGTQLDNENDKIRHGTHRCFKRKVPMELEYKVRKERVSGMTCRAIEKKYGLTKGMAQLVTKTPFIIGNAKEWILSDIEEDGVQREVGEQVLFTLSRIGYLKVL